MRISLRSKLFSKFSTVLAGGEHGCGAVGSGQREGGKGWEVWAVGHMNHAITLGSFSGGRVWVENENGSFPVQVKLRTKTRFLMGTWHDIHDKPMTFDARRFHQVEPHEGTRVGSGCLRSASFHLDLE